MKASIEEGEVLGAVEPRTDGGAMGEDMLLLVVRSDFMVRSCRASYMIKRFPLDLPRRSSCRRPAPSSMVPKKAKCFRDR